MLWGRGKAEVRDPGPQRPHIPVGGREWGQSWQNQVNPQTNCSWQRSQKENKTEEWRVRRVGGNMGLEWVEIRTAVGRATQARYGRWLFLLLLLTFIFQNYGSMITHLQETWKIQNKVTSSALSPSSPLALNLSHHQCLLQWIGSSQSGGQRIGASLSVF